MGRRIHTLLSGYASIASLATLASLASAQPSARPTPPPEPAVRPIIAHPTDADRDRDHIDDRATSEVAAARSILARKSAALADHAAAQARLDERVEVELIFDKQITQPQIDAYLAAGGEISKVFTHVSYGWTGKIARKDAVRLPALLGPGFVAVLEKKPAILHMDEAARTGRVRPQVWNYGINGRSTGTDKITIAILDTGVDGSHTDLTGRNVYWKDWTTDNHAAPQDKGHHGSHVAGIATGTGQASGVSPTTVSYMDLGVMASGGSFYPSPIHIPAGLSSFSWSTSMRWQTGSGRQAELAHTYVDTAGDFYLLGSISSGNGSPLSVNNTPANPNAGGTRRFSTYNSKTSGGGTPEYAMANTVGYTGLGDGYNLLSGVAPDSSWAGFKVFTDNGGGSSVDIDEALDDLVSKASMHNIKVANMSLGYDAAFTSTRNKTNTAAANGVVVFVSSGNSGDDPTVAARLMGDPGRAHYCITVSSSSDVNQLTDYSSHGFAAPGDASTGDEDMKPDLMAPGGSTSYQSNILSVDSNSGDSWDTTRANFTDSVPNNYMNIQGTSMASPFAAGCGALIIDALQQSGETWDFSGPAALADVLKVKQLMLLSATETNMVREPSPGAAVPPGSPTLNRGAKDIHEGYGIVNPDATVEALLNAPLSGTINQAGEFAGGTTDRRCWTRRVSLTLGNTFTANLDVPAVGDYDLYLYGQNPDTYGNPVILASSVNAGSGTDETISYPVTTAQTAYLAVKRVSGGGTGVPNQWTLTGSTGAADTNPPTVTAVSAQTLRTIHVTFSEPMGTGATAAANYTISGAGIGTLAANPASVALVSGNTYVLTWSSPQEMLNGATVTVTVANAQDAAGNAIGAPNSGNTTGIGVAPTATLGATVSSPSKAASIPFTVSLSESSTNFTSADLVVSGATVANFLGSGTAYTFDLQPNAQGTVSVSVGAATFSDAAGNTNTAASNSISFTHDSVAPGVQQVQVQTGLAVDVFFNEAIASGATTAANYTLSGTGKGTLAATPNSVTLVSGNRYRLTWSSGEMKIGGDITITVAGPQDAAANAVSDSGTHSGSGIGTAPTVTGVVGVNRQSVRVTFSEPMDAAVLNEASYAISGVGIGTVASAPGSVVLFSGNTYTLSWNSGNMVPGQSITITASGVTDLAGNAIGSPASGNTVALPVRVTSIQME